MLEEAGEVLENMLKASCLPLGFIVFLPAVLLLVAPPLPAADAAHEFTVYRMQQYDLQGQPYGTRNAVLNTEARTIDADVLSRRCVLMRLLDFSYERYQRALRQSAGAVVIILPRAMAAVPQDVIRQFMEIEPEMLAMETIVPVYFAVEDDALLSIYEQTQAASTSQGSASAAEEFIRSCGHTTVPERHPPSSPSDDTSHGHHDCVLLHTATANGFQMVTSGVQSKAVSDWLITSVEGRLTGLGGEDLPTIVIVAHYDAFGVAPWLSHGADSNGSGISVLLELTRLFSRLYTYKRTHAAYNLLFFASGGGKFNYQGTKRWLEDNLDHTDSSLLQDNVAFVLCLDTLGRGDSLHLHVSKPPREGTLQHSFLRELETVAAHQFPEVRFSMVHKKINLAEDILAWEHERFAIRRLPAFTLSHLESHRDGQRSSIMDVRSRVDSKTLTRNTRLIAEALTRVIYNLTEKGTPPDMPVFTEQMQIQREQLDSVMDWLTAQPRAAQLVGKDGTFLSTLQHHLGHYLKEVRPHHVKADKRDPEFVFYDQLKQVMNAYRVKPAIFDLLLAVCIGAYLGMAYTAVQPRKGKSQQRPGRQRWPPSTCWSLILSPHPQYSTLRRHHNLPTQHPADGHTIASLHRCLLGGSVFNQRSENCGSWLRPARSLSL
ncbi:BOS complex subunit NCLN isoform X1 [Lagenorhynchus albirostris]|uniref:BOS complex subunit NCLN isoform X1 n=1 Tax=Lagenorhynchus albirostris TaxID=27610 RepID=UPI0028E52BF1|nr:BOS complex subunit NCLN isoform X1 [Lagenorhynchus albirostris]